jgi:hypothetical protein
MFSLSANQLPEYIYSRNSHVRNEVRDRSGATSDDGKRNNDIFMQILFQKHRKHHLQQDEAGSRQHHSHNSLSQKKKRKTAEPQELTDKKFLERLKERNASAPKRMKAQETQDAR